MKKAFRVILWTLLGIIVAACIAVACIWHGEIKSIRTVEFAL